jgi:hypothetical protein
MEAKGEAIAVVGERSQGSRSDADDIGRDSSAKRRE